ncbi:hypothetical protein [Veillonella sp. VA139]|uniref:hypothetical protein n=1 Tax=Veillonella sp. VA139 TaxID=741830 RepID=UPI0013E09B81|nr:hypothetical protein [Veillonella sp. VA139]
MHKDVPVLTMTLTENHKIKEIISIIHEDHKPLNMHTDQNQESALYEFMTYRSIPYSRKNLSQLLSAYEAEDSLELSIKSYQLSVSDHYWIKPIKQNLSWNDVNFFTNSFKERTIFIREQEHVNFNDVTPNTSVNGSLRQMWIRENNQLLLMKAGNVLQLEPFNEVFVSKLLDTTNICYVQYELRQIFNGEYVCVCPIFTNESIEFIPAWSVVGRLHKKANKYEALLAQCEELRIPNYRRDIAAMILVDYITLNDDRHWGNFGFLRDSSTLEYLGVAPIFDNGNSLWYDQYKIPVDKPFYTYRSQPFTTTHDKQIKYIEHPIRDLDIDSLIRVVPELLQQVYSDHDLVTSTRKKAMEDLLLQRIEGLKYIVER